MGTPKVLLIEDQEEVRESVKTLLEIEDFAEVRAAESGREAHDILNGWQPNIILLDIGLPDIDGFELARSIRADERFRGVRIIAMTGFSARAYRVEAADAGFDDYLDKPISFAHLKKVLGS